MTRLFAIPDIHGRLDLLKPLLRRLVTEELLDLSHDKLIFLGDMVDRGTDSKGVIDMTRRLAKAHPGNVVVLAGNHEWLMIDALVKNDEDHRYLWLINGGGATLRSYDTSGVPDKDVQWLSGLPLFHEEPGFFFSHAPVPPESERNSSLRGKPFTKQELIWTYHSPEAKYARVFEDGVIGVCGHVHALSRRVMEPRLYDHYYFCDAGAGCSPRAPLVAVEVRSKKVIYQWPDLDAELMRAMIERGSP